MAKAASRNASSQPVAASRQAKQAPAKAPAKPASAKPVAAKTKFSTKARYDRRHSNRVER